ncbi:unnamed protein product [Diatraea saccharalis]|uniref:Ribosomal protein L7Ae/L30e/S12e/Gadd45 domain-containing protein n=1 Tax=Diatraea saccharalis TaxID=40085 RepID=A0A9P0CB59_9NEOP|nr:unnamed protein product [Diatraea saccharalis]
MSFVLYSLKLFIITSIPIFYLYRPSISEDNTMLVNKALNSYKIDKPRFEKLHWKDLKQIPKDKRPKPPKMKKIEGLLFGISECFNAVNSKKCAAVIMEASINPRIIVQPILEACVELSIPVICVNGLRTTSFTNFNIPTSCLGIECGWLPELHNLVLEIAKEYNVAKEDKKIKQELMETAPLLESVMDSKNEVTLFPYLYRTDKKSRIFVPSGQTGNVFKSIQALNGQDFIKIKDESNQHTKDNIYMQMIVKRISNNQNRAKTKKL